MVARWLELRQRVRELSVELRKKQEALRALEQSAPWLGSIKGQLRNKDGKQFDVPEGPRPAKPTPPQEQSTSAAVGTPLPKRARKRSPKKQSPGPLLEKAKKEALAKKRKLQTPPTAPSTPATAERFDLGTLQGMSVQMLEKALAFKKGEAGPSAWGSGAEAGDESSVG